MSARSAPDEFTEEQETEYYKAIGVESDLRERYRLPGEFLRGLGHAVPPLPQAPTIVLINSRSGGRAGPQLTSALRRAIGHGQVLDLGTDPPNKVLETLWRNFDAEGGKGSGAAGAIRERLRIVAAGGDGTVAWVLQSIARGGIEPQPAVAVVPLGTGNDLSRSFGWGGAFSPAWIKSHKALHATLEAVAAAPAVPLDRWRLRLAAPSPQYFSTKRPYAFIPCDGADSKAATAWEAFSWNYVSVGMDAKAAHGFHELRESKPKLAFSRAANQFWYGYYSCAGGWFCGGAPLNKEVRLELRGAEGGAWREVPVPAAVRAIVMLNLQSYAGGRDLWHHDKSAKAAGFSEPAPADGLIEVVGFKSGYQAGAVMAGATHAVRFGQAAGVRVRVAAPAARGSKGAAPVFMQLDGEPWKQPAPTGDGGDGNELVVEMTLDGQSRMLAKPGSKLAKAAGKARTRPPQAAQQAPPKIAAVTDNGAFDKGATAGRVEDASLPAAAPDQPAVEHASPRPQAQIEGPHVYPAQITAIPHPLAVSGATPPAPTAQQPQVHVPDAHGATGADVELTPVHDALPVESGSSEQRDAAGSAASGTGETLPQDPPGDVQPGMAAVAPGPGQ